MKQQVFDGHNDILTQLMEMGGVSAARQFLQRGDNHIDAIKAREGGLGGGLFALWVPSPSDNDHYSDQMTAARYDIPLPPTVSQADALRVVNEQIAILERLERQGSVRVCTTAEQLRTTFEVAGPLAVVMHLEGAEAIDSDFHALDVLYRAGLRSLGPVWSRGNRFGVGVPFRFPSSPDIGEGLTLAGMELVRYCDERGILLDLSHLNLKGFDDVARISGKPLVASHSNAHVLCEHARNLTDAQLSVIRASNGLVGLNYATAFLRADGRMCDDVMFDTVLRHLDHLLEQLGEEGVALGSDFDGALPPKVLKDCSRLPDLVSAMRQHGYDQPLIDKICYRNWFSVLERTWG